MRRRTRILMTEIRARAGRLALCLVGPAMMLNPALANDGEPLRSERVQLERLEVVEAGPRQRVGRSVAIDRRTIVLGGPYQDLPGAGPGRADLFEQIPDGADRWERVATLAASEGHPRDSFGHAVGIDDDFLAVGAPGNIVGPTRGAVHIFERAAPESGGEWVETVTVRPPIVGPPIDWFGSCLALSGGTLVVGSQASDRIRVYERDSRGSWPRVAQFEIIGGDHTRSLAVDGHLIAIGAATANGSVAGSGVVVLLERDDAGRWRIGETIEAPDPTPGSSFGSAVALDGDTLLVGAYRDDETGVDTGAAYVFAREREGDAAWRPVQKLVDADPGPFAWMGHSVALDGDLAVVNAILEESIHFYVRDRSDGSWRSTLKLDNERFTSFGGALALRGTTLAVGAPSDGEDREGVGYALHLVPRPSSLVDDLSGEERRSGSEIASHRVRITPSRVVAPQPVAPPPSPAGRRPR